MDPLAFTPAFFPQVPGLRYFAVSGFLGSQPFGAVLTCSQNSRDEDSEVRRWLSAEERDRLTSFGPARQRDFLLGRRAAKLAAAVFLDRRDSSSLTVTNDEEGRPFLPDSHTGLTLAHGGGSALCLLHSPETPMGVDLEPVVTKTSRIGGLKRMIRHEEIALAGTEPASETELLYRMWSLKEAVGKALGTGLAAPFDRLDIGDYRQRNGVGWAGFPALPQFLGVSFILGDLALSVAAPQFESLEATVFSASTSRFYRLER